MWEVNNLCLSTAAWTSDLLGDLGLAGHEIEWNLRKERGWEEGRKVYIMTIKRYNRAKLLDGSESHSATNTVPTLYYSVCSITFTEQWNGRGKNSSMVWGFDVKGLVLWALIPWLESLQRGSYISQRVVEGSPYLIPGFNVLKSLGFSLWHEDLFFLTTPDGIPLLHVQWLILPWKYNLFPPSSIFF